MPARAKRKRRPSGGTIPPPLGETVLFRLIRLVNLAARPFLERIGRTHALSLPEWRVLIVLARHPRATGAAIAFASGLDKMAVSRAIAALERAGRIVRRPDPDDRRMDRISLSPAGRRVYEAIAASAREREATILDALTGPERDGLAALVDRLIAGVVAADAGAAMPPRRRQRGQKPKGS